MDLADVALFRTIAISGSLSAAARQLSTTPMTVSRRLAAFEEQVGARLFHRTTRSLSLTAEGEAFLPHASQLLETQDAALASIMSGECGLTGTLKVTAPNVIGHTVVVPVVAELIAANPALKVDLTLSDAVMDIANLGLDVAIRVSPLEPSDMVATKIAANPRIICAAPDYIARFGKPETIADLVSYPCIKLHGIDTWPFIRNGNAERVRVDGPMSTSTVDAVRSAAIAGVGVAMMTYWDVWRDLERGTLEHIQLSDADPDELNIWALFPSRKQMPSRLRAFIESLRLKLNSDQA
jgi:DNA-binding transcriptional LysR family regulator